MKKILSILPLVLFYWIQVLYSQTVNNYPLVEKVALFTDRYLYIVGEDICFSAFIENEDLKTPLSTILYSEIITSNGKSISTGKFPISESKSTGCLIIPDSLITGVYYIRAYTKYMRNAGPKSYEYLAIKIINPNKREVLSGNNSLSSLKAENKSGDQIVSIELNKTAYYQGEDIIASLEKKNNVKSLIISVVPENSQSIYKYVFPDYTREFAELNYYPETRGITLTGILQNAENELLLTGETVNLSIIGEGKDFIAAKTDNQGRFFIPMPLINGSRDIFIGTSKTLASSTRILIDNDFCALPVKLPAIEFALSDDERSLALEMAIRLQLKQSYNNDSSAISKHGDSSTKGFYGTPVHELSLNDYVQLPNLEEYFNELPGYVKVRKSGGKKYFKVLGSQVEMNVFDPLVLVDWVAVDNPEHVLSISPSKVEKIEMINEPYVKGNFLYGGLISIITKSSNFAGINLPQSGVFINYSFLSYNKKHYSTVNSDIPDFRNTIYYMANPNFSNENKIVIDFRAPFTPGKYKVIIKGIDQNLSEFYLEKDIEVINQMQ